MNNISIFYFDLIFIYRLRRRSSIQASMSQGSSAALDISIDELLSNSQSNYNYRFGRSVHRYFNNLGPQDAVSTEQILPDKVS